MILVGLALGLVAGCGDVTTGPGAPGGAAASPAEDTLPAGWRLESFGGVEVGVPGDWGYAGSSTGQITNQWCVDRQKPVAGVVARPGVQTLVACGFDEEGDPGTRIAVAGTFVAFDGLVPVGGTGEEGEDGEVGSTVEEGDRTTVAVGTVRVLVQAPAALREQIVATIRPIETDSNGCAISHPISDDPGMAPDPATEVGSLSSVTAVAACKYAVGIGRDWLGPGLVSSLRLTGPAAQAAIDRIAQAPRGGGPNAPSTCAIDYSYGDDIVVLSVTSGQTTREIYLRYSGCDHNGFDDGVAVRSLTAAAVEPFVAGPNAVGVLGGPPEKVEMIG